MPDATPTTGAHPLSGTYFVAVGEDGLRTFSLDGKKWTAPLLGKSGESLTQVTFGGGRCVAFGRHGGNSVYFSTRNGRDWTQTKYDAKYVFYIRGATYFKDRFLGYSGESAGQGKLTVFASADGIRWEEPNPINGKHLFRRFVQGNDFLLGVGDYGRRAVSRDGFEWKETPDYKPVDTLVDVAFGNGVFVGGGLHGLRMRSTDGLTWTHRAVGEEGEHINSMIWDGKQFVGIGQGATYFSADGEMWKREPNKNAPTTAAFGGGAYVGALWLGKLLTSKDAVTWEETAKLPQHIDAIAYGELKPE